jgi:hypothetical protein
MPQVSLFSPFRTWSHPAACDTVYTEATVECLTMAVYSHLAKEEGESVDLVRDAISGKFPESCHKRKQ